MGDSDETYRPRESDHLVEPMFAGLGVGDEDAGETEKEPQVRPTLWTRLVRFLRGRR